MDSTDVLVIGGSAAGIVAATTAKAFHPDKSVMLVRKEQSVLVPCGIPYVFGTLDGCAQNQVPDAVLTNAGVTLRVDEIASIDQEKKVCRTVDGSEIGFDKLVLAIGSTPTMPAWLEGGSLENVFLIPKDRQYLEWVGECMKDLRSVVVLGGGFIGVEVADELNRAGRDVTLVEALPHVLSLAFDDEFATRAEEVLSERGVKLRTGVSLKRIEGDEAVTGVLLDDGTSIAADAVVVAVGYLPNTVLAERAGFATNEMGFIRTDEYMRTDNPDVFAVGDCAEKSSFITRTLKPTMLASTSCAQARIAAMNLYKLSTLRAFGGTIAIFCTALGDAAFGAAGVTERLASERGFDTATGTFEGVDHHPGTLPGTHKQVVKLVASRDSGIILGGEVFGGASVGELTNLIGFIIQNRMTAYDLLTSQFGTHPLLTAAPTGYPLIKAAEMIAKQQRVLSQAAAS